MAQKDYHSLGGWLLFFVIISITGTVSNLVNGLLMLIAGDMQSVPILCIAAVGIAVVVQIFLRKDTARIWYIVQGALLFFANAYTCYMLNWESSAVLITVMSALAVVAWSLYFAKSTRVEVYMHPDKYPRVQPTPYAMPYMNGQPYAPPYPQQPQTAQATQVTQATQAVCPSCGAPLREGAQFCGKCGSKVTL